MAYPFTQCSTVWYTCPGVIHPFTQYSTVVPVPSIGAKQHPRSPALCVRRQVLGAVGGRLSERGVGPAGGAEGAVQELTPAITAALQGGQRELWVRRGHPLQRP